MIADYNDDGIHLRVRLTPNSRCCKCGGVFIAADGAAYLKITVVSAPEKGKANQELMRFLSKKLKVAKSNIQIVSGETDRCKKILIRGGTEQMATILEEEAKQYDSKDN